MSCKNVRVKGHHVKGYTVPAKRTGKHKHKAYRVPGHHVKGYTRKVC